MMWIVIAETLGLVALALIAMRLSLRNHRLLADLALARNKRQLEIVVAREKRRDIGAPWGGARGASGRMSARIIAEVVHCRMPSPDLSAPNRQGETPLHFNYLVVLIEDAGRVTAKRGGGTDPQWVANHGETLPFQLARVYFPNLELSLDTTRREYVAA